MGLKRSPGPRGHQKRCGKIESAPYDKNNKHFSKQKSPQALFQANQLYFLHKHYMPILRRILGRGKIQKSLIEKNLCEISHPDSLQSDGYTSNAAGKLRQPLATKTKPCQKTQNDLITFVS